MAICSIIINFIFHPLEKLKTSMGNNCTFYAALIN